MTTDVMPSATWKMNEEQLNTTVQRILKANVDGQGIRYAVENIVMWVDGKGLKDVRITEQDLAHMPEGSVVDVDGTYWYREVYSAITGDLCWTSPKTGAKWLNSGSLILGTKSVRLVRWGHHINL